MNTPATLQMLQLAAALRLHPERDLHPSWLPAAWPARHRQLQRLGPAGRAVLADWLRAQTPDVGLDFAAPRRRLLLLDGSALRRIAFYAGLALHAPLLRPRGGLGAQLRRQARRIDRDAQSVVLERLPPLRAFKVALARVDHLIRHEPFISVRVAPQEEAALRGVLDRLRASGAWAMGIAVQPDAQVAPGSCVLHTPSGTLEIGLQAQIEALRRAIGDRAGA